jgi:hypothetical protein
MSSCYAAIRFEGPPALPVRRSVAVLVPAAARKAARDRICLPSCRELLSAFPNMNSRRRFLVGARKRTFCPDRVLTANLLLITDFGEPTERSGGPGAARLFWGFGPRPRGFPAGRAPCPRPGPCGSQVPEVPVDTLDGAAFEAFAVRVETPVAEAGQGQRLGNDSVAGRRNGRPAIVPDELDDPDPRGQCDQPLLESQQAIVLGGHGVGFLLGELADS